MWAWISITEGREDPETRLVSVGNLITLPPNHHLTEIWSDCKLGGSHTVYIIIAIVVHHLSIAPSTYITHDDDAESWLCDFNDKQKNLNHAVPSNVFISSLTKFLTELKNYSAYIKVSIHANITLSRRLWANIINPPASPHGINDVVLGKGS